MKKLLIVTAALTLGLSAVPSFVSESQAAPTGGPPTRSEYCDLAKSQRNPVAWNVYYNCLQQPAAGPAVQRKHERQARYRVRNSARDPYCDMAKSQRNPVSWNAHYNCLNQQAAAAPVVEPKREARAKNPYCDLAKSQRNPVSWNARYNCLASR
jgi:hypothetical protein